MIELLLFAVAAATVLAVIGALAAVAGLVVWVLLLPFRLIGLLVRGIAFIFALPVILLFGLIGVAFGGVGLLFLCFPLLPFVLIALGAWWLVKRNRPRVSVTS